jgi:hypothetical protein
MVTDVADGDWATAAAASGADALTVWSDAAVLSRMYALPWAEMPSRWAMTPR